MSGDPGVVVLVVEDDRNIREVICEALAGEGLCVAEAADGEEAVRSARERRPAVVLLDMGLPVLDGAAVADRIRDMYDEPIPVIVVTAGGRAEEISRIRPLAQISKPFDVQHLVAVVSQAVAQPPAPPRGASPQPAES